MFDADAVNAIASLAQQADDSDLTKVVTISDGLMYTFRTEPTASGRKLGDIIQSPKPDLLKVSTLTGFRDALEAGKFDPAEHLIHVEDYLNVALKERELDHWGNRATLVRSTHTPLAAFNFDQYYSDPQKFIIAIQVAFHPTDELLYLIRLASNLKAGNTVQTQDDGFSQSVTIKTGEVSTAEVKVKPRIKLIPIRTFPEAAPVESEFLIRFQQTQQQTPAIALFDVDGMKWKGELMQSIKKWLHGKVPQDMPILA